MIGRVRESRNPKKVIRVALMESYGEIRRVPVNLYKILRNSYVSSFMRSVLHILHPIQSRPRFHSYPRRVLS